MCVLLASPVGLNAQQKQLGEGRACLAHASESLSITEGSQRGNQGGTGHRNHREMLFAGSPSSRLATTSPTQLRAMCSGDGAAHSRLGSFTSFNKTISTGVFLGQSDLGNPSIKTPFSMKTELAQ